MPVKIILIDDHPIVRQGLKQIIEIEKDFIVCGEAGNANDAIKLAGELLPDLMVVDISLDGDINGIELVKALKDRFPKIHTLVLSMHNEALYAERAIRAGARGYIIKKEATKNIVDILRKIMNGEIFLSESVSGKIIGKLLHGSSDTVGSSIGSLTDREFEVFQLIGNGFTTREISEKLNLSINTVESHKRNIKEKLQLKSSTELVKHAVQWTLSQDKMD